jgi:hypothetical protein
VLCARLAAKGGLIRYDPRLAVFHYRRRLFPDHAWQIWNVGRSRGCLIRAGDALSRRPVFAGPACVVALALMLVVAASVIGSTVWATCAIVAAAYLAIACFAPHGVSLGVRVLTPAALLVHHGAYALGMAVGILTGTRTVRGSVFHSTDPAFALAGLPERILGDDGSPNGAAARRSSVA